MSLIQTAYPLKLLDRLRRDGFFKDSYAIYPISTYPRLCSWYQPDRIRPRYLP